MRKFIIPAIVMIAAAGTMLTACQKAPSTPAEKMQQGAQEIGQGLVQAGDQAKQAAADATITAKVKAALAAKNGLGSLDVHVSTKSGVVTLSGAVASDAQKDLAAGVTAHVTGVQSVDDQLEVKPGS